MPTPTSKDNLLDPLSPYWTWTGIDLGARSRRDPPGWPALGSRSGCAVALIETMQLPQQPQSSWVSSRRGKEAFKFFSKEAGKASTFLGGGCLKYRIKMPGKGRANRLAANLRKAVLSAPKFPYNLEGSS